MLEASHGPKCILRRNLEPPVYNYTFTENGHKHSTQMPRCAIVWLLGKKFKDKKSKIKAIIITILLLIILIILILVLILLLLIIIKL